MGEKIQTNPKILIFSMTSWNSKVGSNTWETLLSNYESANLASVFFRDETPDSLICSRYFCISENKIIKSLIKRKILTGREVTPIVTNVETNIDLIEHNERYSKLRKKSRYVLLLVRELIWKLGKWKTKELEDFLLNFNPDIILFSMEGYIHFNRVVEYAIKKTGAKAIGYFWDDTFTYKQSKKLWYKIYRFFQRKSLKKLASKTNEFFAITPKTKEEADKFFGVDCTVLSKPLNASPVAEKYETNKRPLQILYTGNLLIGRDVSLQLVAEALKEINKEELKIVLDVYTQTEFSPEKLNILQNDYCKIYPSINQKEVLEKQKGADVLLFLEDISDKNLTARLSFSTKITDYFSAGKCIFAIGNSDLAPMQYFKDTNSAIVANNKQEIFTGLKNIVENKQVLVNYAENAVKCGIENHSEEKIRETFDRVISKVYKGK